MAKSNNTLSEFTDFLNGIGGRITDDTWHAMKIHLNGKLRFFYFLKVFIISFGITIKI